MPSSSSLNTEDTDLQDSKSQSKDPRNACNNDPHSQMRTITQTRQHGKTVRFKDKSSPVIDSIQRLGKVENTSCEAQFHQVNNQIDKHFDKHADVNTSNSSLHCGSCVADQHSGVPCQSDTNSMCQEDSGNLDQDYGINCILGSFQPFTNSSKYSQAFPKEHGQRFRELPYGFDELLPQQDGFPESLDDLSMIMNSSDGHFGLSCNFPSASQQWNGNYRLPTADATTDFNEQINFEGIQVNNFNSLIDKDLPSHSKRLPFNVTDDVTSETSRTSHMSSVPMLKHFNRSNSREKIDNNKQKTETPNESENKQPDFNHLVNTLASEVSFANKQAEMAGSESCRNAQLRSTILKLKEYLSEARKKYDQLSDKSAQLLRSYNEKTETLKQLECSTNEVLERFKIFRSKHSSCSGKEASMKAKLMELVHKLDKTEQTAADIKNAHNTCVEILNKVQVERKRLESENRKLKSQVMEVRGLRLQLNARDDEANEFESKHVNELSSMHNELNDKDVIILKLKGELEGTRSHNRQLTGEVQRLHEEIGGIKMLLKERDSEVSSMVQKLQRQDEATQQLQYRYQQLCARSSFQLMQSNMNGCPMQCCINDCNLNNSSDKSNKINPLYHETEYGVNEAGSMNGCGDEKDGYK